MFEEAQLYSPVEAHGDGTVTVHLAPNHPGVADPAYLARRGAIARVALDWRPGEPVPAWLEDVRERCAALIDRPATALAEVLVTRYPAGATIGWHRDAPAFGVVVGVSLGSSCALRFQRGAGERRRVFEQVLDPGSAYVLDGPARISWQHSIPAVSAERFSLTFRTVRRGWVGSRARRSDPSTSGVRA